MKIFSKNGVLTWILVVLIAANVAVLATVLINKPSKHGTPREKSLKEFHPGDSASKERGWQWRKEIGLDEVQHEKMLELRKKYKAITTTLMDHMKQTQGTIFEELQKPDPNAQKLDSMAVETGKIHTEMRRESIKHILEIKSITTPEQQKRMIEFMNKHLPQDGRPQGGRYRNRPEALPEIEKN